MTTAARTRKQGTWRGASLIGASFAGADLRGADFSRADLRGADLRRADLRDADFTRARTGMLPRWKAFFFVLALLLSVGGGVAAGFAGRSVQGLLTSHDPRQQAVAAIAIIALLLLVLVAVWKGMQFAIRYALPPTLTAVLISGVIGILSGIGTGRGALAVAAFLLVALVIVAFGALWRAVAGSAGKWAFFVAAVAGALVGGRVGGGLAGAVMAIAAALIGHRALGAKPLHPYLATTAARIASIRGTRFNGADLRGAHFDNARLEVSDFRGVDLSQTRFEGARIVLCLFDKGRSRRPAAVRTSRTAAVER